MPQGHHSSFVSGVGKEECHDYEEHLFIIENSDSELKNQDMTSEIVQLSP